MISPAAIHLANPSTLIVPPVTAPPLADATAGAIFQTAFHEAVNTVETFQTAAGTAVQNFLSGQNEDVHTPIIATQKADLSFELFMQVRNKVIAAYQEIMKMQV